MTAEKDTLQQFFQDFNPDLGNNDVFMERLNRKLDAIEYIKQVQDQQVRRYRYAMLTTFILGILCGGALFAFILWMPETTPVISFGTDIEALIFLEQNSRSLTLLFIAILMSFGIINVVRIAHDLMELSDRIKIA